LVCVCLIVGAKLWEIFACGNWLSAATQYELVRNHVSYLLVVVGCLPPSCQLCISTLWGNDFVLCRVVWLKYKGSGNEQHERAYLKQLNNPTRVQCMNAHNVHPNKPTHIASECRQWSHITHCQKCLISYHTLSEVPDLISHLFRSAIITGHKLQSDKVCTHNMCRVGQNRIYTLYMIVYLVISLPKIPYIHRIYMVLANPKHVQPTAQLYTLTTSDSMHSRASTDLDRV
jgi:hypothetical protein